MVEIKIEGDKATVTEMTPTLKSYKKSWVLSRKKNIEEELTLLNSILEAFK